MQTAIAPIYADNWTTKAKNTALKYAVPTLKVLAGAGILATYIGVFKPEFNLFIQETGGSSREIFWKAVAALTDQMLPLLRKEGQIPAAMPHKEATSFAPIILFGQKTLNNTAIGLEKRDAALGISTRLNDILAYGAGSYLILNGLYDFIKTYKTQL